MLNLLYNIDYILNVKCNVYFFVCIRKMGIFFLELPENIGV